MGAKRVKKKNAGKPRVLAIYALLHSLVALAATVSAVAFNSLMAKAYTFSTYNFILGVFCSRGTLTDYTVLILKVYKK